MRSLHVIITFAYFFYHILLLFVSLKVCESNNKSMNDVMVVAHPNIYAWLRKLSMQSLVLLFYVLLKQ